MEITTLVIETASIIIAIVALIISVYSLSIAKSRVLLVMGQVEMQIRDRIKSARNRRDDLALRHKSELGEQIVKDVIASAEEEYLNAYEEACQKYLDNKVDRKRFKKAYFDEIRNIVEDEHYAERFGKLNTRFKAIEKVFKEWNPGG